LGWAVVNVYGAIVLSVVGLMAVGQLAAWHSRDEARLAAEASPPVAYPFATEETWKQSLARGEAEARIKEWEERQAEEKAQEEFDKSPQGKMMKKILTSAPHPFLTDINVTPLGPDQKNS
jgi:hypothetical protein